ncbi:response regulator transcription factor [Lutispora thermophila]|uniref:Stage 0 sporulation protein A homolog n=1 Tax=Lutispora thermophila DSM 19022 TaxID=1122184 RepID=A0A1M6EG09_9FIRM|nr:response regulator transcription factor [Lutispora thermophila]SHI84412.1 DNA-binding response regulator, OmpR family, contains REC and winged-helix (wHTH) domain [Lutispora thermophila DSM 19022]
MKYKILVVDDDQNIAELIRIYLEKEMYDVKIAYDGKKALEDFYQWTPDLVILDIMIPHMDGYEVCKQIRKAGNIPIIMLTARGEVIDKVLGLELGADDYIVKPFDPKELLARIKAVLRRVQNNDMVKEEKLVFPGLTIDKNDYTVTFKGNRLELPPKEMELLYFLASRPNQVFTREQLLEKVWDYDYIGDSRTVDVHIKRLREKLHDDMGRWEIKTVWGVGYKFEVKR